LNGKSAASAGVATGEEASTTTPSDAHGTPGRRLKASARPNPPERARHPRRRYVGSWLVRKLLDRSYRVRILDTFIYGGQAPAPVIRLRHRGRHPSLGSVARAVKEWTA
jgi:hypothetical protein